jgi:hypothetical protein
MNGCGFQFRLPCEHRDGQRVDPATPEDPAGNDVRFHRDYSFDIGA